MLTKVFFYEKTFFAICFIVFSAVLINPSNAAIKQMRDEIALQQYNADKSMQIKPAVQNRNIPTSFEAFRDFIRERAQKVEKCRCRSSSPPRP